MTRIIPPELIKHLEWKPGQELPEQPQPEPTIPTVQHTSKYNIDDVIKGKTFYDSKLPVALRQALEHAGPEGIVATMPELIAAKLKADKKHDFWKQWYTVHTEENIGLDRKGRFYKRDTSVLVVVNGGGILTPDRIEKAYEEGLVNGSAKYSDKEFDSLLEGRLPDGNTINIYTLDDIKKGLPEVSHKSGFIIPYELAQKTKDGYHKKKDFMANPLAIIRSGDMENLEAYFDKAKDSDEEVGNHHPFSGRDASQPQGRVLFLDYDGGLIGDDSLDRYGRFVGVAPEAHSARK